MSSRFSSWWARPTVMVVFLAVYALTAGFSLAFGSHRSAPTPVITEHPDNPTTARDARFAFTGSDQDVSFLCSVDWGWPHRCWSPRNVSGWRIGWHRFCVRAVDTAGNVSASTCFSWKIVRQQQNLSIAGSPLPGVLLYPGGGNVPVNLVFTNPNATPITVTRASVTITGTSAAGCAAANFSVVQQWRGSLVVLAHSSQSLQGGGLPQSSWPQLAMRDSGNQDACEHATVDLSFAGTAR